MNLHQHWLKCVTSPQTSQILTKIQWKTLHLQLVAVWFCRTFIFYTAHVRAAWIWCCETFLCSCWWQKSSCDLTVSHLVMEVGWGGGQDAAVGLEHLSLDVDGEVTEPALLPLPIQAVQHGGLSAGEAHLHHRARCVAGSWAAAAAHFHGQGLHLCEQKIYSFKWWLFSLSSNPPTIFLCWFVQFVKCHQIVRKAHCKSSWLLWKRSCFVQQIIQR